MYRMFVIKTRKRENPNKTHAKCCPVWLVIDFTTDPLEDHMKDAMNFVPIM